jgi:hypothetical protein
MRLQAHMDLIGHAMNTTGTTGSTVQWTSVSSTSKTTGRETGGASLDLGGSVMGGRRGAMRLSLGKIFDKRHSD